MRAHSRHCVLWSGYRYRWAGMALQPLERFCGWDTLSRTAVDVRHLARPRLARVVSSPATLNDASHVLKGNIRIAYGVFLDLHVSGSGAEHPAAQHRIVARIVARSHHTMRRRCLHQMQLKSSVYLCMVCLIA